MSVATFLSDSLAIAETEFRQFRRNRSAILISLVVLPLFFTVSLGAGQGGAGSSFSATADIPIGFVDNDNSIASLRLWQTLTRSPDFHNLIQSYNEQAAIAELNFLPFVPNIIPKPPPANLEAILAISGLDSSKLFDRVVAAEIVRIFLENSDCRFEDVR